MKLTDANITDLYNFTREHFVEHYDVQTELVDHLANDIEAICDKNPNLTFEQARDISFKKFGVFGFMDVVEEKQKQMRKKYMKILWSFAKQWFSLPKAIFTTAIFLFFYYSIQFKIGVYIFSTVLLLIAFLDGFYAMKLKKVAKQRFKRKNKKWMLEDMIFNTASLAGIIIASQLPSFYSHLIEKTPSKTVAIILSVILTLTVVFSYITLIVIPKKSEELLEEQYPEYKLV